MLEAALKLLEKLIKLGEVRETNRQRYVDRYATPVYLAAEVIYRDYSSILRDLRRRIRTGRKTLPLIQFVEQRRLDQLPSRIKIRAILHKTPEKNWTRFEQGVLGLINGCLSDSDTYQSIYPVRRSSPGGHTLYDIIRQIEQRASQELAPVRSHLLTAVERQIAGIDEAWECACAGYADLQSTAIPSVSIPKAYVYKRTGD